MVPDRQKVQTDGRTEGMDGRTNARTDDAKTISLRLRRGITIIVLLVWFPAGQGLKKVDFSTFFQVR